MMNRLNILWRFVKYYFRAKTKYSIHSPFVFDFVNSVIEDDRHFYVFSEAEVLRERLLTSSEKIEVVDFGAGSHIDGTNKQRQIKSIAASALSPAIQCEWLFKICNHYKILNIIELGTSLGVSTLYLAEGATQGARILTLEGSPQIAQLAQRNFLWFYDAFKKHGLRFHNPDMLNLKYYEKNLRIDKNQKSIEIIEGNFNETLPIALQKLEQLDLCFIDGNHRYEPTIQYFNNCLNHTHENSILIFDDIHWSEEMEAAWEKIKEHPSVKLTVDLFWCGIVFFRNENIEKEHFTIIKAAWKPFSWGFFG